MAKPNDGGPAFPVPNSANVNEQEGMTLRQWYAGKAMQEMIGAWVRSEVDDFFMHNIANASFEMADEMIKAEAVLAEREKSND